MKSRADVELTRREHRVFELLQQGLSHKEIGERLCIADKSSKCHASNIYKKFGLRGRAQLQARFPPHAAAVVDAAPVIPDPKPNSETTTLPAGTKSNEGKS